MKDCTNCKHSQEAEPCYDGAKCWCHLMEIHIFNPTPYYCSSFESKDGVITLFDSVTESVERLAESSVMEHATVYRGRVQERYYVSPYAPKSIFNNRAAAVIAAAKNLMSNYDNEENEQ